MNWKKKIKETGSIVFVRVVLQQILEGILVFRYVNDWRLSKDVKKLETEISIKLHAIEKGMSIGNGRIGFGKAKALSILEDLLILHNIGGKLEFINLSLSALNDYIEYNKGKGADMGEVEAKLIDVSQSLSISFSEHKGIITLNYPEILQDAKSDFTRFSQSRYSVRDFSDDPIDLDNIRKALKMAERTPSACNRQSWRIHVYKETNMKNKLFKLQGGSKGFYESMQCAILVCVDLNKYAISEMNLPYVDGGLYAMNLIYSLHYYGLATIPLTMGLKAGYIRKIKKEMGIPGNEVPVLLIGVGSFKSEFKVATSERIPYTEYVKFDN